MKFKFYYKNFMSIPWSTLTSEEMEEDIGENAVEKNDRWAVSEQAAR